MAGLAAAVLVGTIGTTPVRAQNRGNFDPAQMRQRYMEQLKERLGASDDEWKVLSPKVEKVMDAQREARSGGGGFGGFGFGAPGGKTRGGGDNGGGDRANRFRGPETAVTRAQQALQQTLENKDASPDEIKSKLQALRDARQNAQQQLHSAQGELKELLTQRQEAMLVMMGTLE